MFPRSADLEEENLKKGRTRSHLSYLWVMRKNVSPSLARASAAMVRSLMRTLSSSGLSSVVERAASIFATTRPSPSLSPPPSSNPRRDWTLRGLTSSYLVQAARGRERKGHRYHSGCDQSSLQKRRRQGQVFGLGFASRWSSGWVGSRRMVFSLNTTPPRMIQYYL